MSEFIEFKSAFQKFVRSMNLGSSGSTPCGQKISPTNAHAIMTIGKYKDGLSQSSLVSTLAIDKSNVTRLCIDLEKQGLIVRTRSPEDKRHFSLVLTKKGEKICKILDESSNEYIDLILSNLSRTQKTQFISLLNKLSDISTKLNKEQSI